MLLENRTAIVYGASGAMGGAVTRAFAREGARLFLAARTLATLDALAVELRAAGATVDTASVDVMDVAAVQAHADRVVETAGRIDISFNAVDVRARQGRPLVDMSLDDFMLPITDAAQIHFITATTAARQMIRQGSGVIILLSSTAAKESRHQMGGFSFACAGIEALTRGLAGEVGRQGVRVVGLRPNRTPETTPSFPPEAFDQLTKDTLSGRLPLLREVADAAVFLASDGAGAMTGAVMNLSAGAIID
jgi:3-oxoacyl-[acyl-carrier protein] reductase